MSPVSDHIAQCTEHVLSLRPSPDETKALRELKFELLTEDVPWPQPLTNYLHRYMHYHNLYHVPKQNTSRISNLARYFSRKAGLQVTDELLESFCQKTASLINTSVRDWKESGMLVATGGGGGGWLRKSPALKEVWDHYKDVFQLLELQSNWASGDNIGKTKFSHWPKRTADSYASGDAKRVRVSQRPGSSEHGHGEVPSDTIVVDAPVRNPTTLPSSAHAQLIHEAQAAVAALHGIVRQDQNTPLGPRPDTRATDPAQRHAPGHFDDGKAMAGDHTARSSTLVRVEDLLASDASPPTHQPSTHALARRSPRLPTSAAGPQHAPAQASSWEARTTRQPCHSQEHGSPQNHISDTPPCPPANMGGPLGSGRREAPPNITIPAPRHVPIEAQVSFCTPSPRRPARSGLAASLEHTAATYPAMHGSQGEAQFVSRKLRELGQLLLARRGVAGLWRVDVDVLMQQDAPKFFDYCCWFMGLPRISRLGVKLPDVRSQETYFLDREDPLAFEAIKHIVFKELLGLLKVRPGLVCFRIEIIAVHGPYYEKSGNRALLHGRNRPGAVEPTAAAAQPIVPAHLYRHSAPYGNARSNVPSALRTHVVVRIQQSEHGGFSCRYQGTILAQGVTSAYFFSWFAGKSGYYDPLGPFELEFYFKDALPPRMIVIARGNEAYFQSMKRTVPSACEQTAAQVPDLFEFAILVRAPGWAGGKILLAKE